MSNIRLNTCRMIGTLVFLAITVQGFSQQKFDTQAHRGGRGMMPENTIEAMLYAVKLGVKTLELDVVMSKDQQVVVSHDTYMASAFMLTPNGEEISKEEEKSLVLYQMDYKTIKNFDGGNKVHPQFPDQKKMKTYKPLLAELIDSVETYIKKNKLREVSYNIEIKSSKAGDGIEHPNPPTFAEALMKVLNAKKIDKRTMVQSFDVRPLQYLQQQYPKQELSFLIANTKSYDENIADLGFTPNIISPYYKMLNKEFMNAAHAAKVSVIPWTVNTKEEIEEMAQLGVDGIISDFPQLLIDRFGSYQD
ncbi:MAG: glycerophosphodiester phosphodiesterase family protein [Pelobium sp.]